MKAKGGTAKMGDVIPYIFCTADGEESTKALQAERAKHPDEVRKSNLQVGKLHHHELSHCIDLIKTTSTTYLSKSFPQLNAYANQSRGLIVQGSQNALVR
jgi:hypothetical protein